MQWTVGLPTGLWELWGSLQVCGQNFEFILSYNEACPYSAALLLTLCHAATVPKTFTKDSKSSTSSTILVTSQLV